MARVSKGVAATVSLSH